MVKRLSGKITKSFPWLERKGFHNSPKCDHPQNSERTNEDNSPKVKEEREIRGSSRYQKRRKINTFIIHSNRIEIKSINHLSHLDHSIVF